MPPSRNFGNSLQQNAYVEITEQPCSKSSTLVNPYRFRYKNEGKMPSFISGVSSTLKNRTFPSIRIVGYRGRAKVIVSCVTEDEPYRTHPHDLTGREPYENGVYTVIIDSKSMSATFSDLGIRCAKQKEVDEALREKEIAGVDPFQIGFDHRSKPSSIDLNAVRLCFQVFLENTSIDPPDFTIRLQPVVSDPIYNNKPISKLVICKLSKPSCSVAGGEEIILLCEDVDKEDIAIRFFHKGADIEPWEAYGHFDYRDVHKKVAISFRTPQYRSLEVERPVKCSIQLERLSDGAVSEPVPFEYLPIKSGIDLKRKRLNFGNEPKLFEQIYAKTMDAQSDHGANRRNQMTRPGQRMYGQVLSTSRVSDLAGIPPRYFSTPSHQPNLSELYSEMQPSAMNTQGPNNSYPSTMQQLPPFSSFPNVNLLEPTQFQALDPNQFGHSPRSVDRLSNDLNMLMMNSGTTPPHRFTPNQSNIPETFSEVQSHRINTQVPNNPHPSRTQHSLSPSPFQNVNFFKPTQFQASDPNQFGHSPSSISRFSNDQNILMINSGTMPPHPFTPSPNQPNIPEILSEIQSHMINTQVPNNPHPSRTQQSPSPAPIQNVNFLEPTQFQASDPNQFGHSSSSINRFSNDPNMLMMNSQTDNDNLRNLDTNSEFTLNETINMNENDNHNLDMDINISGLLDFDSNQYNEISSTELSLFDGRLLSE